MNPQQVFERYHYHHHPTEEKTEAERQSDLPKATELVKVPSRVSRNHVLDNYIMLLLKMQLSFCFYDSSIGDEIYPLQKMGKFCPFLEELRLQQMDEGCVWSEGRAEVFTGSQKSLAASCSLIQKALLFCWLNIVHLP